MNTNRSVDELIMGFGIRWNSNTFEIVTVLKDFDYSKFDTDWSHWLIDGKYVDGLDDKSFNILKGKYKDKMLNAPTEDDKHVYYKYFASKV